MVEALSFHSEDVGWFARGPLERRVFSPHLHSVGDVLSHGTWRELNIE